VSACVRNFECSCTNNSLFLFECWCAERLADLEAMLTHCVNGRSGTTHSCQRRCAALLSAIQSAGTSKAAAVLSAPCLEDAGDGSGRHVVFLKIGHGSSPLWQVFLTCLLSLDEESQLLTTASDRPWDPCFWRVVDIVDESGTRASKSSVFACRGSLGAVAEACFCASFPSF
jgi:hypothetical protein